MTAMFDGMRRLGAAGFLLALAACASLSCNAVLGLDDLRPRVDAGTVSDAGTGGPLRIANPSVAPTCLMLQGDRIFYCVGQRVIVAKRDGSEARDFVADGGVGKFALGLVSASWTSNGMLMEQPFEAGAPYVVVDGGVLEAVAISGPFIYFSATADSGVELRRVPPNRTGEPLPVLAVSSLDSIAAPPNGFADIFVADENRVSRVSIGIDDGGLSFDAASVVSLDATAPHGIVPGGSRACWIRGSTSNVDTTQDFLVTSPVPVAHTPTAIACFGEDIFTVSASDGLVLRRTPSDTTIVATGQSGVRLIAVDDVSIAWATATAIFVLPRL